MGLNYERSNYGLSIYVDADYANCPETRRSITGFAIMMGSNLVS